MGKTNTDTMLQKATCDIYIDCVNTDIDPEIISGKCTGRNSHESLALEKVTFCSLDNYYFSFFPDTPIFFLQFKT